MGKVHPPAFNNHPYVPFGNTNPQLVGASLENSLTGVGSEGKLEVRILRIPVSDAGQLKWLVGVFIFRLHVKLRNAHDGGHAFKERA